MPTACWYYWAPALLVLATALPFRLLSSSKKPQGLSDTDTDTTSPAMTHTVVVLGAGMAGVPLTHHLLKHTPASVGLHVVLVSPNDELLWTFATVRAILPDAFDDQKIFHPLGPGFAKYAASKFEHVVGTAQSLEPEVNRVVISKTGEQERTIDYDTLIIATGSSFKEAMPFKNLADTAATKGEIHSLRKKIAAARSIVVAGAGQTGVEVAGELGQAYGLAGTKEITLIADDDLPLGPETRDDVRQTVVYELAQLNVKVVSSTRVVGATTTPAGKQALALRTGGENKNNKTATTTTLETDLYIPTFGVHPNTAFVPPAMLDPDGRVKVDRLTLQATGHTNIFAVGDASNAQTANAKHADAQVRFLAPAMQSRLAGHTVPTYQADDTFVFAVTLGPYRGTGQVGSWRLWGWIIRMSVAKHMGTDYAPEIAAGNRTMTETKW
jgi:NADH dehydrogenase FAD-containing subunit